MTHAHIISRFDPLLKIKSVIAKQVVAQIVLPSAGDLQGIKANLPQPVAKIGAGSLDRKRIDKPIGISEYQLTKNLPNEFKSSLPSVEEIEAELGGGEE